MKEPETRAIMGLTCVLEPGQGRWNRLVGSAGAEAAWARLLRDESPQGVRARRLDLDTVERETRLRDLRFVHRASGEWLSALDDLESTGAVGGIDGGRPLGLWVAGPMSLSEIGATGVAIVGSRASTPYGDTVASELAAELAEAGTVIVSGGAFGIDAAAHRGALSSDGATVAVMACGLDQLYPRGNDALLRRVRDTGLVVSEYPPGATPTRHRFLTRNRLIAAIASATVIVEAAAR
ncbi:MAG TPA: DNA-processing protein DprA, partial [Propionibacteriaceae bacterium]|nr:DNA-processing protein DprA [Propionibacteriaceae bacterium]